MSIVGCAAALCFMKRKTITRKEWQGIYKRSYAEEDFSIGGYSGKAGLIMMLECDDFCINAPDYRLRITHKGYSWLSVAPRDCRVWATVMFDATGCLFQCYFDVTAGNRVLDGGASYFDDMYLDAVVRPESEIVSLYDKDELDAALASGEIGERQHASAVSALDKLLSFIELNKEPFFEFCRSERSRLLPYLEPLNY